MKVSSGEQMEANWSYQGQLHACLPELEPDYLNHGNPEGIGFMELDTRKPWTVLMTISTVYLQLLNKCCPTVFNSTLGHDIHSGDGL